MSAREAITEEGEGLGFIGLKSFEIRRTVRGHDASMKHLKEQTIIKESKFMDKEGKEQEVEENGKRGR